MNPQSRVIAWFALRSLAALLLLSAPAFVAIHSTHAQDAGGVDTPVDDSDTGEPPAADSESPSEPQSAPTEEPVDTGDTSQPEVDFPTEAEEAVNASDPATVTAPPEDEPSAETPPTLNFDAPSLPACLPVSSESIAAGGDLEYTCSYSIAIDGASVDPAAITLDWSIVASVGSGWSVQLLDPTGDPPVWTQPDAQSAAIGFQTRYGDDVSVGPLESLQDVATIQFGMLVHRPECSTDPVGVELDASAAASIPGYDAIITTNTAQPLVTSIDPALAALDTTLPTVTILDVSVDPVAFSLTDTQTHGTLTIRVDNPVLQCRTSNVSVSVQTSADSVLSDSALLSAVGPLDESTIVGAAPEDSGEGKALDGFVAVSALEDRAEPGSYIQTIDFELTVPGGIVAGTYQLSASALVEPAG